MNLMREASGTRSGVLRIIIFYRYASWFLTSLYYVLSGPDAPIVFKIGVVVSLLFAAGLVNRMYAHYREMLPALKLLILFETIGILLLLLPTEGLASPFIWYALNPVLVAASFLPRAFCWLYLAVYITAGTLFTQYFHNPKQLGIGALISDNASQLFVFLLITLAVQLLGHLTKELDHQASQLKTQMNHIMSLYQIVEASASEHHKEALIRTFADYAVKLTQARSAFFWLAPYDGESDQLATSPTKLELDEAMNRHVHTLTDASYASPREWELDGVTYFTVAVQTPSRYIGRVGIETDEQTWKTLHSHSMKQLTFLAELSALILERVHLDELAGELLITEEQNRIANDMHDSVSQRLFGIVYAIHAMKLRWNELGKPELKEEFEHIADTAKTVMHELRSTIYQLSSRKKEESLFYERIQAFLKDLAKLNKIKVNCHVNGGEEALSISAKKALYRVICEATGNAVRHGRCSEIAVTLEVEPEQARLHISDNGAGFDTQLLDYGRGDAGYRGLGMENMRHAVHFLNGTFRLTSRIGTGTDIDISIPIPTEMPLRKEGA
ncbi:sensor histidine kinase [Paenibacillus sp. MBLB4367]|uniref:sensor histidine kinase n=1 Tax=Paenibacillus sp. MBLB4367 TaxID=3384767 RepID=UPI003908118D